MDLLFVGFVMRRHPPRITRTVTRIPSPTHFRSRRLGRRALHQDAGLLDRGQPRGVERGHRRGLRPPSAFGGLAPPLWERLQPRAFPTRLPNEELAAEAAPTKS